VAKRVDAEVLATDRGTVALASLTRIERMLCTALIARQFTYRRNIDTEVERYGLEGAVRLSASRAIGVYLLAVGLVATAAAISGHAAVAVLGFVLVWALLVLLVARAASANRSRKLQQ
jgi:hypothetical protein